MLYSRSLLVICFLYSSMYILIPNPNLYLPLSFLIIKFVFPVCDSTSVLYISSFVLFFFRFHIEETSYDICLSLSALGLPMLYYGGSI